MSTSTPPGQPARPARDHLRTLMLALLALTVAVTAVAAVATPAPEITAALIGAGGLVWATVLGALIRKWLSDAG
ncbi:hypothetical protein [Streptodolium elevatio]|uniref:Uncharacterized protein n=1 Tax=Streptodolium elevatio TaxID=3157996 RepID=A0ABV3DHG0_9ACTN